MTGHTHSHAHTENPHAGQGAVMLDIGGTVGAVVVTMPEALVGEEVEARPAGWDGHSHLPHVGVVARPLLDRRIPSAVFPALAEGEYELYLRPHGPVALRATVVGGEVTALEWPG